jgi:hypothetical protein
MRGMQGLLYLQFKNQPGGIIPVVKRFPDKQLNLYRELLGAYSRMLTERNRAI